MRIYLNSDDAGNSWNKKRYLLAANTRLGLNVFEDICTAIDQPEYVLNIEPFRMRTGLKWTGIWDIDLIFDKGEMNGDTWGRADTIFTSVSLIPPRLEQFRHKTKLLFQACDPTFNKRIIEPELDFVICGSGGETYRERERIYDIMKSKFKWEQHGKGLSPQEYSRVLNKAKVQFIRSANTPLADGEIAQRFFECLAIGPVLTNWVDDLKHTGLIEGEDYMAYRDDKEMVEKMELLLNPELNKKIANNGRNKALLFHTYEHRAVTIIQTINERITS